MTIPFVKCFCKNGYTISIGSMARTICAALVFSGTTFLISSRLRFVASSILLWTYPEIPRFPYEAHRAALSGPDRRWPESTRRISELRIE
ncbi:MAG: YcjX family protein, partial [Clostridia bacterium]|nr:YcjX family protein [Clostridia bacterium]